MRLILFSLFLAIASTTWAEEVPGWAEYDRLVRKYAVMTAKTKGVKYREWKNNGQDVAALRSVLNQWAKVDPKKLPRKVRQAFYINLYNATMLDIVLRNYPIKTVTTLTDENFGIFEEPVVRMAGKTFTLNRLEKSILMSQFRDPRNHFAVNCSAVSCPPLAPFAYDGKHLNDQLDFVTRSFCKTAQAFQINTDDREIRYSKLFKWYKDDFYPDSPHRFISRTLQEYVPPDFKEEWLDYNWNLNDAS